MTTRATAHARTKIYEILARRRISILGKSLRRSEDVDCVLSEVIKSSGQAFVDALRAVDGTLDSRVLSGVLADSS